MAPTLVPDLTEELWAAMAAHLSPRPLNHNPKGGRPRSDDRACFRGILYLLREGCRWQKIPCRDLDCPSGSTCWRRFRAWTALGLWEKVHVQLLDLLSEQGLIRLEQIIVDSASVRAQKGGRTPAPLRSTGAKKAASVTC